MRFLNPKIHSHVVCLVLVLPIACLGIRLLSSDIPSGSLNEGKCRMVINEANLYPNGAKQFLELKKICDIHFKPKQFAVSMKFYKLLFISHDGFLLAACLLDGKAAVSSKGGSIFYTISWEESGDGNFDLRNCHFHADASGFTDIRLPIGSDAPVGIALVYSSSTESIKDLDLVQDRPGVYGKTKVDSRAEKKIRENLMDLIIITSSSPYTHCKYFERYFSGYDSQSRSILRDYAQLESATERSLSRCLPTDGLPLRFHFHPFQASLFGYAPPTMGSENKCEDSVQFIVEEYQPRRKIPRTDFAEAYGCSITTEDDAIESSNSIMSPFVYNKLLHDLIISKSTTTITESDQQLPTETAFEAQGGTCSLDPFADHSVLGSSPILFTKNQKEAAEFEQELVSMLPLTSTTCDNFPHTELVKQLQCSKNAPIDWKDVLKEDTCFWFEWLPNHSFRCRLCNKLLQQGLLKDRPGSPKITKIMTVGQINKGSQAKALNRGIIRRHNQNPLHSIAVFYANLFQGGQRGHDLKKKYESPGGPLRTFTNATEGLFAVGFSLAVVDLPFYRYPRVRELLEYFNANIGHVYANPMGIQRIQRFISDTMHENLLTMLKQSSPEFSLLIDTSTDVSSIPALAIVIQTFDTNGDIKLFLYKVVWVEGRETGEELFQLFLREVRKDGLDRYVQEKCIGFASDGGSNVLLFREKLKSYTNHADKMIMVHCFAHKSELVMKHAWEDIQYLKSVEDLANTLHRIFGCRSAKKKRHLQLAQAELGDTSFSLSRLYKTRWVAPRLRALDKIIIHWKTIVKALQRVMEDSTIKDSKQRLLARDTRNLLLDPTFIITTAFVADVYTAMSAVSLKLQDRGSTLIGKKERRVKLKQTLNAMKTSNGPFVRSLLHGSRFSSPSLHGQTLSVQNFETGNIYLQNVAMNKPSPETSENGLDKNRQDYINRIIRQLDLYFPEDPTDQLDILDPSHWPLNSELDKYGNDELKSMNSRLRWNYQEKDLLLGWTALKKSVVTHDEFGEKRKNLNPEMFWSYFLKQGSVSWSLSMRQIISNVITIPASTAEVERIFSYYTQIKTARRYNLDVSTVDALIRIRFNGPSTVRDFDTLSYAWKFMDKHARADDSSKCTSRTSKKLPERESDEDFFSDIAEDRTTDDQEDTGAGNSWYNACASVLNDENENERDELDKDSDEDLEDDLDEIVRELELQGQS